MSLCYQLLIVSFINAFFSLTSFNNSGMESIGLYLDNSWTWIDILVKTGGPRIPQIAEQVLHKNCPCPWYPLVICYITMENHHFSWENPLFLWSVIFHRYVTVITSGYHNHSRRMTGWMVWICLDHVTSAPDSSMS